MAVIQLTSREFRDKQAAVFDLADKGTRIIISRGKKKAYTLTPVSHEDIYFTPQMLAKIDKSIEEIKSGKAKSFKTFQDLSKHMEKK